ncbi:hypothetical protein BC936DRAFT_147332 [Jimgerdemannia flammicorona]|uniref:IKI3 family-domain-containing protein n=1 Tax=Jimgerdemannia flammicorona TaxID=994334 RepID=A0A433D5L9_9FUNG|nr:hypothetical protein BC936DRAFT_147332 [Jimgerdemannia flammicorona]
MPRGNLETLSPRALVLSSIRDAIDRSDYRAAFLACRKHRVDLNILFDYSPSLFLEKIGTFVAHLQEVDFLNLFLSSLRNEDVTITMYPSGTQTKSLLQKADSLQSKVNTVCDAIRAVLVSLDTKHYIQSILSTYVRKTPPDYESALSLLASLRSDDLSHAEEALKYTIFLCDVDRLYDIALGMYDFSLVLMVAQQTQKDPREYLPFLQELQNLEVLYQRFKIDDHLQRHEKALLNLCLAGDQYFAEVVKYMQKHSLYQAALRAYRDKPVQKKVILAHYGEYLMERSAYGEAGIVFVMADSRKRALDAYQLAGAWREVFMLSRQLMFTEEDVVALAKELVGILQEKRLYTEAATVAADYGKDVEGAVDSLIKGYLWTEAARLSYLHGRDDLIQTNVIPGLIDGFSQITEDMAEMSDQFTKQTERLREIRAKTPDTSKEHDIPDDSLDNIDMFSDTTSMGSQFTRYTQATSRVTTMSTKTGKGSKNRRREERKRARGKKGSVFEEEYLVNSLKRLIQRAANFQNDIGNLLKALATYGFTEKGKAIQVSFDELLTELRASLDEIFVPLQLALNEADPPIQRISTDSPQVSTVIEKPLILDIEWKLPILQV